MIYRIIQGFPLLTCVKSNIICIIFTNHMVYDCTYDI